MGIIITVRIQTDVERALAVQREAAATYEAIIELARRHGMTSHRRLYGDGEILDVDEWESVEAHDEFVREAAPLLREMSRLRGSPPPESKVWRSAEELQRATKDVST